MASKPPRPCRAITCGALSRDGSGYCTDHIKQASGWNRQDRATASQRGYGSAWKKIRHRVMVRDKGLCMPCMGNERITRANAVDHIKPKSQQGTDSMDNLQAICNECHKVKTHEESRRGRGGE